MIIDLFVCCHKEENIPKHELLKPIQVGSAIANKRFKNFYYDDTGDNISKKNRSYCELTAQYWAWKNIDADYYGFFHYRRYLYPSLNEKKPYQIKKEPSIDILNKLGYQDFQNLISKYDIITPIGENMYIPVREYYARAKYQHGKDLKIVEDIISEKYSEMTPAMDKYLSGTICYFGNIFIMRREVFEHYCEWLFSILEEFDRKSDSSGYNSQEARVDGYLGEHLLGIYYTYCKDSLKSLELPRVIFISDTLERRKNKFINALLPPGSKRRSMVKKAFIYGSAI